MVGEASVEASSFVVVEDVSKRFGPDWALARARFAIGRGELALLTGANGSGKTTLIQCLSTELTPDFGRATIGGCDLVDRRDDVRRLVSSLSVPAGAYGELTARENLSLTAAVLGLSPTRALNSILDRVGLTEREDTPVDSFSAGMKQRFALARISLLNRDLVLLDEPETHLDADGLQVLLDLIAEWKTRGTAILCATHAPERFKNLGDLEVRLVGGRAETPGGRA